MPISKYKKKPKDVKSLKKKFNIKVKVRDYKGIPFLI
jgi:hypothetical protein